MDRHELAGHDGALALDRDLAEQGFDVRHDGFRGGERLFRELASIEVRRDLEVGAAQRLDFRRARLLGQRAQGEQECRTHAR
jgi:hypothetical protein